jgi:hypothetical protein
LVMESAMRRVKSQPGRFRVGSWVTLLYGPRIVLARVIEDRGPLGWRGRRLYTVRLESSDGDPVTLEVPEEHLTAATKDEVDRWRSQGSVATHQTVTYNESEKDEYGMPRVWYHYLIVAKPGPQPGSGIASILSLSKARATGIAQGPSNVVSVPRGGPDAALAKAVEYLDSQHPGLEKVIGEKRP